MPKNESKILCYLAIMGGCILMLLPLAVRSNILPFIDEPAGIVLIVWAWSVLRRQRRRRVRL